LAVAAQLPHGLRSRHPVIFHRLVRIAEVRSAAAAPFRRSSSPAPRSALALLLSRGALASVVSSDGLRGTCDATHATLFRDARLLPTPTARALAWGSGRSARRHGRQIELDVFSPYKSETDDSPRGADACSVDMSVSI